LVGGKDDAQTKAIEIDRDDSDRGGPDGREESKR